MNRRILGCILVVTAVVSAACGDSDVSTADTATVATTINPSSR